MAGVRGAFPAMVADGRTVAAFDLKPDGLPDRLAARRTVATACRNPAARHTVEPLTGRTLPAARRSMVAAHGRRNR